MVKGEYRYISADLDRLIKRELKELKKKSFKKKSKKNNCTYKEASRLLAKRLKK